MFFRCAKDTARPYATNCKHLDFRTPKDKKMNPGFHFPLANDSKFIHALEEAKKDPQAHISGNTALVVGNSYFLALILSLPEQIKTLYICDIDEKVFYFINKILTYFQESLSHTEFLKKIKADSDIQWYVRYNLRYQNNNSAYFDDLFLRNDNEFYRCKEKLLQRLITITTTRINLFDGDQVQQLDLELKKNGHQISIINLTNLLAYDKQKCLPRTLPLLTTIVAKPIILSSFYYPYPMPTLTIFQKPYTFWWLSSTYYICSINEFPEEDYWRGYAVHTLRDKNTLVTEEDNRLAQELLSGKKTRLQGKYMVFCQDLDFSIKKYEKSRDHIYRTSMATERKNSIESIRSMMEELKSTSDSDILYGLLIEMRDKAIKDHRPVRLFDCCLTTSGFANMLNTFLDNMSEAGKNNCMSKYQNFIQKKSGPAQIAPN